MKFNVLALTVLCMLGLSACQDDILECDDKANHRICGHFLVTYKPKL